MGAELEARAMSHLEEISDQGIVAMAKANSVAVILPTTAYILRLKAPPVRKMIDGGVPVALGTDFNPNAFCMSMVRFGFQIVDVNQSRRLLSLKPIIYTINTGNFNL